MEKIIGQIVKEVLDKSGLKLTAFAERIGTSRQNVYKIFEKESISTKRLMRISQVLEYDFFQHFRLSEEGGKLRWDQTSMNISYQSSRHRIAALQKELKAAKLRIHTLGERLADKEHIIDLLRSERDS
ncbi:MAG TPA: XRE family transcriptional regulator [Bacteroidetes bacterium]|nr:XRE family transcriptional regulator [Bacteroidota bacterium]